jgi:hypothetical protein
MREPGGKRKHEADHQNRRERQQAKNRAESANDNKADKQTQSVMSGNI